MKTKSSFSHKKLEPESGFLYIVGTPIGNLNDLSNRAINILKKVSLIACEDTRQTKKIMSKFEFTNSVISFNQGEVLKILERQAIFLTLQSLLLSCKNAGSGNSTYSHAIAQEQNYIVAMSLLR